jgi:hypothetical protein
MVGRPIGLTRVNAYRSATEFFGPLQLLLAELGAGYSRARSQH